MRKCLKSSLCKRKKVPIAKELDTKFIPLTPVLIIQLHTTRAAFFYHLRGNYASEGSELFIIINSAWWWLCYVVALTAL